MWWNHSTWCLVVALSVLTRGSKVPRQIVYQIRPAPLSAFSSQDGRFLLDDGVTEFQFPTFGLKNNNNNEQQVINNPPGPTLTANPTAAAAGGGAVGEGGENDSSASSSSSLSRSEEASSAATKEEITEVPKFGASQVQPQQHQQQQQFLQLQPEQIHQIFRQIQPHQQQQFFDIGPQYEYRSVEENSSNNSDDIKTSQTEVITEDRLQSAYSERKEKRKKKEPPMDASYAFGYETDEAARHEVADPSGNVKGWYTYVDDEGTVRKIIYTAGAGKGFVVLGKEKVRGPAAPNTPQQKKHTRQQQQNNRVNTDFLGYAADTSTLASVKHQKPSGTASPFTNLFPVNNWNDLAKAGTSNPPVPATIIATAEPPQRKKPVFIVKIRRPVSKDQFHKQQQQQHQKHQHHLSNPEPLPLPATSLKSTRSRRKPMTLSDVVPSLRKRIKKYPTPPVYYADDDDDDSGGASVQGSSSSVSSSSSSSAEDGSYHHESSPERGSRGSELPVKSDPDSSYVFGYESETANRLEKQDAFGNVRGSYSYIDPDGVKRTVHYIAGGNTGFQVIHASPSITRGVRLEAPPGYVVKRVPSLRASESRFPIPITVPQPSAIVYHIHPDSGWKPWEPTLRKKKIKIHRKKLPKTVFENPQREGLVLIQRHPDPIPVSPVVVPSGSNTYFKEKITAAGGQVTAKETQYPPPAPTIPPPIPRRRHAPQRGYTAEHHLVQIDDEESKEHIAATTYRQPKGKSMSAASSSSSSYSAPPPSMSPMQAVQAVHEREPLLYSPTFESMKDSSRMPIAPNPIQLQPTQVAIKSRGAPTTSSSAGLETSSSNHHPVAFTSDGKLQVDVPTVVIEAIEAKPSLAKDEKAAVAAATTINQLPEAAALTQSSSSVSSSSISVTATKSSTPTYATYESTGVSSSTYYQPSSGAPTTTLAAAALPPPSQSAHAQVPTTTNNNQLASATPRAHHRRRHHRSKTPTTAPTSPTSSSGAGASGALKGGSNNNNNINNLNADTTMMSNSKRLINRLAVTDQDVGQQ